MTETSSSPATMESAKAEERDIEMTGMIWPTTTKVEPSHDMRSPRKTAPCVRVYIQAKNVAKIPRQQAVARKPQKKRKEVNRAPDNFDRTTPGNSVPRQKVR